MEQILNIPAQVICSCNISGEFTPIRFRYETPACELITINVLSVDSRKHQHMRNTHEMTYVCRGQIDTNIIKTFRLRYHIASHRWTITSISN